MTEIRLRPAVARDCDAIAEIWHAGASLPGVGPPQMPTVVELKQRVPREFEQGWIVTVAESGGRILGFIAVKPTEGALAELFLRLEVRGHGVGELLMARAREQMPDGFTLFTRVGNGPARRFYERQGLVRLREAIHPRFGDAIVYYGWSP